MSIIVNIQLTGESGGEIANDLRHLLNSMTAYKGEPISTIDAAAAAAQQNEPRMTAAEKKAAAKAAEKAAMEAAERAAKAAAATTTGQGISTGDERTEAQDKADEAADTAATKPVDLTHDDVKKMLGGYVQAYGMAAAQEDGEAFINAKAISAIPNNQAALAAAIIGIAKGINDNPKKRDINGDGLTKEKTAELKVIVAAAMAVK